MIAETELSGTRGRTTCAADHRPGIGITNGTRSNVRMRTRGSWASALFADGPAELRLDCARVFEPLSVALPNNRAVPSLRSQRFRLPSRCWRRHWLFPRQGKVARCQAVNYAARSQSELPRNRVPVHPQVCTSRSAGERPHPTPAPWDLPVCWTLLPLALPSRRDG